MGDSGLLQSISKDTGGIVKMKKNKNLSDIRCIRNPDALKSYYEAMLGYWPVPMEKIFIPTSLGRTFCIKSGEESNPPMILIHGAASNSATWMADIKKLNNRYLTYCLDIPGDPGGSEDRRFSWKGPYFSQWIKESMDFLNINRSVVGGLSLGGWASLRFAIDYPERVNKLYLLAPAGLAPLKALTVMRMLLLSLMGKWGHEKILKMLFKGKEITPELRTYFEITAKNCKARHGKPPVFTDEQLSSLKMPVVFIGGKNDLIVNTEKSLEKLSQNVSNLKSLVLEEGHGLIGLDYEVFELLG
jgi:pimeloyl-ACP methyl ester carboxylesterase